MEDRERLLTGREREAFHLRNTFMSKVLYTVHICLREKRERKWREVERESEERARDIKAVREGDGER